VSIFREHKTIADRAASDRSRHRHKIEKAIKESIKDVVAEESIIGQSGKKKIRIPVKGIKEHRFVYGSNEENKRVGSAQGKEVSPGQRIGHRRKVKSEGEGDGKAGNKPGEEMYEIEMSLEELAGYLFSDLELPELEKKSFKFTTQEKMKRKGKRPYGIRPRLSKKETIKQKIKRKKAAIKAGSFDPESGERFTFHESDLRYKHIAPVKKENTAAVVFFVMDVSGSMTKSKKFLARSFFFLLYQFLNHKYSSIDVVFISHTADAKEVNEDQFFTQVPNGGTLVSTGLKKVEEIIEKRYHPNNWNIYTFYCGDGDNWSIDNEEAIEAFKRLKEINQAMCYTEIGTESRYSDLQIFAGKADKRLWDLVKLAEGDNFKRIKLAKSKDVWPAFKKLFGGR
jgi:sporulation protein YhbH|tara:strand:+ start:6578 stop:7765 length:1188 start_codon:yes stop_codon:yes gene_type:complete